MTCFKVSEVVWAVIICTCTQPETPRRLMGTRRRKEPHRSWAPRSTPETGKNNSIGQRSLSFKYERERNHNCVSGISHCFNWYYSITGMIKKTLSKNVISLPSYLFVCVGIDSSPQCFVPPRAVAVLAYGTRVAGGRRGCNEDGILSLCRIPGTSLNFGAGNNHSKCGGGRE